MSTKDKESKLADIGTKFQSIESEAVITLLKTVDYVNRNTSETIEPYGVTTQQYNILRILRGVQPYGLKTLELADKMLVKSPGITRLIDKLEKKGLVDRHRSEQDRRVVKCKITETGLNLLEKMDNPVDQMNEGIVQNLGQNELETLINLLNKMRG